MTNRKKLHSSISKQVKNKRSNSFNLKRKRIAGKIAKKDPKGVYVFLRRFLFMKSN